MNLESLAIRGTIIIASEEKYLSTCVLVVPKNSASNFI
jgi:hypothetical protein